MPLAATQESIQQIISAQEMFYCERFKCRLSVKACIKRQKISRGNVFNTKSGIAADIRVECADCGQGKEIRNRNKKQTLVAKAGPKQMTLPASPGRDSAEESETPLKTKRCWACKAHKPLDRFSRNAAARDGLQKICKDCAPAVRRKYRRKKLEAASSGDRAEESPFPVKTKKCWVCKTHKPLDQFSKNAAARDGLQTVCKKCAPKIARKYKKQKRKTGRVVRKHSAGIIEVDFAENRDLFDRLIKCASDAFRTPENHVMWLIKQHCIQS